MKIFASLATLATVATVASAKYDVSYTHKELKCEGAWGLVEYKPESSNCEAKCQNYADNEAQSVDKTCAISEFSREILVEDFVFVKFYESDAECTGDFRSAIAVLTDGECYANVGDSKDADNDDQSVESVIATLVDGEVSFTYYEDQACQIEAKTISFTAEDLSAGSCLSSVSAEFFPAVSGSSPGSVGGEATESPSPEPTTAPATPDNGTSTAETSTPEPATTKPSSAAVSTVTASAAAAIVAAATIAAIF